MARSIDRWCSSSGGGLVHLGNIRPCGYAVGLGTAPDFFSPRRDTGALRRRLGLGAAPLLLTVARLVPHKGQDIALRALAPLAADFPELRYLLFGEGHDQQRLEALARDVGVAERVFFAGVLTDDEIAEAYATATLYVGLSRIDNEVSAEGFGISFNEAAASGVPAVAGDSGGVRSAVLDGKTGLIVPPTDVEAVSTALRSLLTDDDRRTAMAAAARNAAETHYNWDRVARETLDFASSLTPAPRGLR